MLFGHRVPSDRGLALSSQHAVVLVHAHTTATGQDFTRLWHDRHTACMTLVTRPRARRRQPESPARAEPATTRLLLGVLGAGVRRGCVTAFVRSPRPQVRPATIGVYPSLRLEHRRLELGVTRAAAEAIMQKIPTVQIEGSGRSTSAGRTCADTSSTARSLRARFRRTMFGHTQMGGHRVNGPAPSPGGES